MIRIKQPHKLYSGINLFYKYVLTQLVVKYSGFIPTTLRVLPALELDSSL